MTIEQQVIETLRDLPAEKQKEALESLDSLKEKNPLGNPRRSLRGLWKGLNVDITEEDIAEARREMWGNLPRDLVPEMPDRIIAATALHLGLPLVTRDRRLQAAGIPTIG